MTDDDDLPVNTKVAARRLGLAPITLAKLRVEGGGPSYLRLSRRAIRYRPSDLQEWALSKRCSHTAQYQT